MGEDVPNVDFLPIEMNSRNEPILIPADIKNYEPVHIIGAGEMLFQVTKRVIVGLLDNTIPSFKRRATIRILGDKIFDPFMGDDVHTILYLTLR
jgi:hypothetical protein